MKFLRVVGFMVLGASLAQANSWTDEQAKKADRTASAPASSAGAAPVEKQTPAPAQTAAPDDSAAHVVVKGETLWGMAGSFYNNPYDWKRIWDANKNQIDNPDLIFPDQKFVIPGKTASSAPAAKAEEPAEEEPAEAPAAEQESAAATTPEPAKAEAPAATEEKVEEAEAEPVQEEAVPPAIVKKTAKARGAYKTGTFLTEEDWEGSGKIVGDQDHKILLGQGDVVYLNIGAANGVKAKMRGTVYRRGRLIRDPHTGDKMGYAINRLGLLEITQEVTDNTATAVIMNSEGPVRVGDFVSLDE